MPKKRAVAAYLKRQRWSSVEAREALAAQAASGLSMAAFAEREGLKVERLLRWRRELDAGASAGPPMAFVELRRATPEPVAVVLRSGRVLRVSESIEAAALKRIVAVLEDTAVC